MRKMAIRTVVAVAIGVVLGMLLAPMLRPQTAFAQGVAPAASVLSPVVATAPYAYTTENEQDPFNEDRIRRTRTTVTAVVLVHADGTTEIRKTAGN
ncbi:hypothetical protein LLH03_17350 [bacterium]|nr:hypothetical protein [bacterium]